MPIQPAVSSSKKAPLEYGHGLIIYRYVDEITATGTGLINTYANGSSYIGVDHTNKYLGSSGRPSVRLTSTQTYTHGLFIADIANMPGGVCGTWPAFWTLGTGTWPYNGEIDIIEGVNNMEGYLSSLHTAYECSITGDSSTETGIFQTSDCQLDVATGGNSAGCGVSDLDSNSFGLGFNANGGGVYAMDWTSDYIKIWFFPRGSIPDDITTGWPNPCNWGKPVQYFQGCDIDANFKDHQIVIDNTFCGAWSGMEIAFLLLTDGR